MMSTTLEKSFQFRWNFVETQFYGIRFSNLREIGIGNFRYWGVALLGLFIYGFVPSGVLQDLFF
jgi:hypothetical protein